MRCRGTQPGRRLLVAVTLSAALLAACSSWRDPRPATTPCLDGDGDPELDRQVLAAVLRHQFARQEVVAPDLSEPLEFPVSAERRAAVEAWRSGEGPLPGDWQLPRGEDLRLGAGHSLPASLIDRALRRSGCPIPDLNRQAEPRVVRVEHRELARLLSRRHGWRRFHERYPGARGVVRLSLPSFADDHSLAAVSYGFACGLLCGYGEFVLLERREDKWQVVWTTFLWES